MYNTHFTYISDKYYFVFVSKIYLFLRAHPDFMLGLLDSLLGAGNGDYLAGVVDAGHANLGCCHLLQVLKLLPLLAEDPAVMFFGNRHLLACLEDE